MSELLDVIILAAGIGARIKSAGNNLPKCLLSIDSKQTILSRQVTQFLAAANVNRILIATGFEHDLVAESLSGEFEHLLGSRIFLEYNPFYSISNNLVSLWNVRGLVIDSSYGIVISNGDNVYGKLFSKLVAKLPADNVVVVREKPDYDGDDMKVVIRKGCIRQITKNISSSEADGEAIGLSKFNLDGKKHLFEILDVMVRNPRHLSSFYLRAFEYLISDKGLTLRPHEYGDTFFEEVDFPEDYQKVISTEFE